MSEDFNLKTLIGLVRAVRALTARGDNLPKPLSEEHRKILTQATHAWVDRIVNAHMAPSPEDPELSIRDILSMVKACDAFLVRGDGHAAGLSPESTVATYSARMVMLARVAEHPNGDLVAEAVVQSPAATAARARATQARETLTARQNKSPAPAAVEAAPQPAPVSAPPVQLPEADPGTDLGTPIKGQGPDTGAAAPIVQGDAFVFGPPAAPEPLPPDPTPPAPAAQPEAGLPQAQP